MRVKCEDCGKVYDDAQRWTLCPHPHLDDPAPQTRRRNTDGDAPADAGVVPPDEVTTNGDGFADELPDDDFYGYGSGDQ